MSKIHLEILDAKRLKIFKRLSQFRGDGYLAGGTALALQIKHRKSFDFDVFIKKPVDNNLRIKVKKVYGNVDFYVDSSDQISFKTKEGISVTFVWYYFNALKPVIRTESISLADPLDIAADKVHTIGRRAMWRDYVDIFCFLKNNIVTLHGIIKLAEDKFKGEFVQLQFLEQLPYFADLKKTPIEFIDKSYRESEIKSYLEKRVDEYVRKELKFR